MNTITKKPDTNEQFSAVMRICFDVFEKKFKDYKLSWTILRVSSITDQIFIKLQRIRSIEEKGEQKIEDSVKSEYIGALNYSIMALLQIDSQKQEITEASVMKLYKNKFNEAKELLAKKNHDYDEAWRDMRVSSITDLMLMKILRLKQIEDNKVQLIASEGESANYLDIINYCVFALIRIGAVE